MLEEAASDTVMAYLARPDRVHADSGDDLYRALTRWAWCNVSDLERKSIRRRRIEGAWGDLHTRVRAETVRHLVDLCCAGERHAKEDSVLSVNPTVEVLGALSPEDRAIVELMRRHVRLTETYASVLGLEQLPWQEQRREVVRVKARLRQWLKRHGLAHVLRTP